MGSTPIKSSAKWANKVGGQNYAGTNPAEMARRNAAYALSSVEGQGLDARVHAALVPYGLPNVGTYMAAAREINKTIKKHSGPILIAVLTAIVNKWVSAMGLNLVILCAMILSVFGIDLSQPVPVPVSGNLRYLNPGLTIMDNVTINLKQGAVVKYSVVTDINGDYVLAGVLPGAYDVVPSTLKPWGGVNAVDKVKINAWIAAPVAINKVIFHASDCNPVDESLDAVDAQTTFDFFLGIKLPTDYARGEWTFWKQGDTIAVNPAPGVAVLYYPLVIVSGSPPVVLDLYGRCVGDFDGNYAPPPG